MNIKCLLTLFCVWTSSSQAWLYILTALCNSSLSFSTSACKFDCKKISRKINKRKQFYLSNTITITWSEETELLLGIRVCKIASLKVFRVLVLLWTVLELIETFSWFDAWEFKREISASDTVSNVLSVFNLLEEQRPHRSLLGFLEMLSVIITIRMSRVV